MISIVPPELAERTLALCHFRDVAAFAQTCRRAYALVYRSSDQYLWRTLFLRFPFDDPHLSLCTCTCTTPPAHPKAVVVVDWRAKLQRRVRTERIARRDDGDRRECVAVLLECIREAARAGGPSHNLAWVTRVLTLDESPWIERSLRLGQQQLESLPCSHHRR